MGMTKLETETVTTLTKQIIWQGPGLNDLLSNQDYREVLTKPVKIRPANTQPI